LRFLRKRGGKHERAAPADGLESEIAVPEGLEVRHGPGGNDLVIAAGEPGDPRATSISVGACVTRVGR
jgi:hypothetical protein